MTSPAFVYDRLFLEHRTPPGHPEQPDRLRTLLDHLERQRMLPRFTRLRPRGATDEELLLVHTREHVERIREVCARGGGILDDGDTHASAASADVAILAAGAVLTAVDAVLGGEAPSAFCAVRPPGHHAERDRPMGFCLLNNVAIAARSAVTRWGLRRLAILDWDVHHGNGTQRCFESDPSVLFISLHQYPFYPGSGARGERGRGAGEGTTLNIPLPSGSGETEYLRAFHEEVLPALQHFGPELLLISAGFDAHRDDPLGGMMLEEESYGRFTALIRGVAPIVSVLEGGYSLPALSRSVESHLRALLADSPGVAGPPSSGDAPRGAGG
jgi:acetoin utilization deacetylase AcuC-like enzyme